MSQIIGYVKALNGEFIALDSDGQERGLSVGDPIYLNDEILGDGRAESKITIFLEELQGNILLAGNEPLLLNSTLLEANSSDETLIDEKKNEDKKESEEKALFNKRDAKEADLNTELSKKVDKEIEKIEKIETQEKENKFVDRNADEVNFSTKLAQETDIIDNSRFKDRNADETDFNTELFNIGFENPSSIPIPAPPPYESVPEPLIIQNTIVEEGSSAVFQVLLYSESEVPYKITLKPRTDLTAEDEDIEFTIIVKDSNGNEIVQNSDGTYTVPVGERSLKVYVPTVDDDIYEKSEQFELIGQTEFMDSPVSGKGTIVDDGSRDGDDPDEDLPPSERPDDDRPKMTIQDIRVEEGSNATFEVTLSNKAEREYKVTFNTATDLTAEAEDISSPIVVKDSKGIVTQNGDGSYTVAVGETALQVLVPTIDDEELEVSEDFTLSGKTEFMVTNETAVGTIIDDGSVIDGDDPDNIPDDDRKIGINDVTVEEGSNAIFTVTLPSSTQSYKITFNPKTDLTAEAEDISSPIVVKDSQGTEITVNSDGTYTVPAGETSLKVLVPTVDDEIYEGAEKFILSAKADFMTDAISGIGTILDAGTPGGGTPEIPGVPDGDDPDSSSDDDRPKLSIQDVRVEEGSNAIFEVTLSNKAESEYKVTFSTVTDLTAEAEDISSPIVVKDSKGIVTQNGDGSYTVAVGETALQVLVPTIDDEELEVSEDFTLSGKTEFMVTNETAVGTIIDDGLSVPDGDDPDEDLPPAKRVDDDRPQMSIKDVTIEEGSNAIFEVTLSNKAESEYKVTFSTATNLTAEAEDIGSPIVVKDSKGSVITLNSDGTYTVPVGETLLKVLVPTIDDEEFEVSEDFTLSGKTEFMVTDTTAVGTITDNGSGPDGDDPDDIPDDDTPPPKENIVFESNLPLNNYGQISGGTSVEDNIFEGKEKPADDVELKDFTIQDGTTTKAENEITVTTKEGNVLVVNTDSSSANFGNYIYTLNTNMYHIGLVNIDASEGLVSVYKDEFTSGTDGWENSKDNGTVSSDNGSLIIEDQQYATKIFTGIAGQEVVVEFDFKSNDKWSGDYFKYYINDGNSVASKHSADETEHYKFLANFDENGQLEIMLRTDGDAVGEISIIDNFTIKVSFLDRVTDNFTYTLSDDTAVDFEMIIKDDVPIIDDLSVDIVVGGSISTNLLLVLDRSSSMNSKLDDKQYMSWMTESLTNMVKKYNELGEVNIKIVGFWGATEDDGKEVVSEDNDYDHEGYSYTNWLSVEDALSYLAYDPNLDDAGNSKADQIFAYDGTWYDTGIDAAREFYEINTDGSTGLEPEIETDGQQTIAYFLTDGEPTSGHAEQGAIDEWTEFVKEKVDMSIAVGFKDLSDPSTLNKLTSHGDATIVKDVRDLNTVLVDSVLDTQGSFSSFTDESNKISFGADGGNLLTLEYDGIVLTYDSSNVRQVAHLEYGDLEVDFNTGFYVYKPNELVDVQETIKVELVDSDGDVDGATIVLNISYVNNISYDATNNNNAESEGVGTLVFAIDHNNENIDFSTIADNKIINFEAVNLNTDADGTNGTHELTNITLSDIVSLTDSRNNFIIFGDEGDKVELLNDSDGEWSSTKGTEIENGHTFDIYTNSGDASVELRVETSINDNII